MNPELRAKLDALMMKARGMQMAADCCDGHIWRSDHVSMIDQLQGSSAVCIRCGERRAWRDIPPDAQTEWQVPAPPDSARFPRASLR